jgi:hypothetical protein
MTPRLVARGTTMEMESMAWTSPNLTLTPNMTTGASGGG